jgi:hypothetical protein
MSLDIDEIYSVVANSEEGAQCGKREDRINFLVILRIRDIDTLRHPTCFNMLGYVNAPTF